MSRPIEKHIAPLVRAMNEHGLETYASCEGHELWLGDARRPYIAYRSQNTNLTRQLCMLLRRDAMSNRPQLYWSWEISAGFDADLNLVFRLHAIAPHNRFSRWFYRRISSDMAAIARLLERAQHYPRPLEWVMPEEVPRDCEKAKNQYQKNSRCILIEAPSAKRIRGSAADTGRGGFAQLFSAINTRFQSHGFTPIFKVFEFLKANRKPLTSSKTWRQA